MSENSWTVAEIAAAERRFVERDRSEPRITGAVYDAGTGLLTLSFRSGQVLSTPARDLPGLEAATHA